MGRITLPTRSFHLDGDIDVDTARQTCDDVTVTALEPEGHTGKICSVQWKKEWPFLGSLSIPRCDSGPTARRQDQRLTLQSRKELSFQRAISDKALCQCMSLSADTNRVCYMSCFSIFRSGSSELQKRLLLCSEKSSFARIEMIRLNGIYVTATDYRSSRLS